MLDRYATLGHRRGLTCRRSDATVEVGVQLLVGRNLDEGRDVDRLRLREHRVPLRELGRATIGIGR